MLLESISYCQDSSTYQTLFYFNAFLFTQTIQDKPLCALKSERCHRCLERKTGEKRQHDFNLGCCYFYIFKSAFSSRSLAFYMTKGVVSLLVCISYLTKVHFANADAQCKAVLNERQILFSGHALF